MGSGSTDATSVADTCSRADLNQWRSGNEQEQRGARRLVEARLLLETVIIAVEQVKGQKWDEFREKHGYRGRDMVLYLGRRVCGLKLAELAKAVGLRNYAVVATNAKRYERTLEKDRTEQARMKQVCHLLNCKI